MTLSSYVLILGICVNLNSIQSPLLGFPLTALYLLVEGVFLGHAFFNKQEPLFRLMLGLLLLVVLVGFFGWLALVLYNLDATRLVLVLFVVSTLSSILNRGIRSDSV